MSLFGALQRQADDERHRLLSRLVADHRRRRAPIWPDDQDGFMPADDAAAYMGMTRRNVIEWAQRGYLDYRADGNRILIRPAAVTFMGRPPR